MGTLIFPQLNNFAAMISETVGYNAGVALSYEDITDLMSDFSGDNIFLNDKNHAIRIYSGEVESILCHLYWRIGAIESPDTQLCLMRLSQKYRNTDKYRHFRKVADDFGKYIYSFQDSSGPIDLDEFMKKQTPIACKEELFFIGQIVLGLVEDQRYRRHWQPPINEDFDSRLSLGELFNSEGIVATYGQFIDQRFIDYLARNTDDIDLINWRKFEGLVAEYFHRYGLKVEIGPGRNDDGIDLRIWYDGTEIGSSLVVVQCKREKRKISKAVVKALWADLINEKAESALIITTSELSPGAKKTCSQRKYPISEINREAVIKWIRTMRSPVAGFYYL